MATGFLSPIGTPTQQWFSDQGVILSGGLIYTYLAGTTTPAPTFTGPNLTVANPNPIVLNSSGRPPQEVWLQQSVQYKFVITDANNNPLSVGTFDNISGVNDVAGGGGGGGSPASEWIVSSLTPTFVDGTHFTVPGNQTTTFTVNRRVYATVTAGTIYGSITASSFSGVTTVTVVWDSGALDSGLSSVAYGILNAVNPSLPANESVYKGLIAHQEIIATGVLAPTPGANRARIRMVGGGGAGGGVTTTGTTAGSGGGGSAGSFIEFWINSGWQALAGTTLTIGAAGVGVSGANGGNGGNTTFGAIATAPGGVGGGGNGVFNISPVTAGQFYFTSNGSAVPTLPTSSAPAVPVHLESGQLGKFSAFSVGPSSVISTIGGEGGSGPLGSGGKGGILLSTAPTAGTGYGSGGGGNVNAGASSVAGANAGQGVMLIEEFL
jgi:hypothetical protein